MKKAVKKNEILKNVLFFVLFNGIIISLVFLAFNYLKVAIGVLLLLLLNFVFYSLFKVKADRDISKIDVQVGNDEVSKAVSVLRFASAALAFISFLTTAEGLREFVFTKVWQAYMASFSFQSILLVFNYLFFQLYIRMNKIEEFPMLLKRVLSYCIVLLFTISLTISSTFSYVFIANNAYKDMYAENSDIEIEAFLTEKVFDLREANEITQHEIENNITFSVKKIGISIDSNSKEEKLKKVEKVTKDFYPEENKIDDNNRNGFAEEREIIYNAFKNYNSQYNDLYSEYERYFNRLSDSYTEEINNIVSELEDSKNRIQTIQKEVTNISGGNITNSCKPYKNNAISALSSLVNGVATLKNEYSRKNDYSDILSLESSVNALLKSTETDEEDINKMITYLSKQYSNESIDDSKTVEISNLISNLKKYNDTVVLKNKVDSLTERLKLSYVILSETENTDMKTDGNIVVVSEAEWKKAREADFAEFISCLKLLPDLEGLEDDGKKDEEYNEDSVLEEALALNRDLLEDISGFERAINYFKHDYKMMAVFSLMMALILDIASFLTGSFMFGASFFNKKTTDCDSGNCRDNKDNDVKEL